MSLGNKSTAAYLTLAAVLVLLCSAGTVLARPAADSTPRLGVMGATGTVSPLLNYQARLVDPGSGQPVADGNYSMTFKLYSAASGGLPLWTETKSVPVTGGLFSTSLGDSTALESSLFNGQALWLGVRVGADAEATPRQQLLPVAYALSLVPGAVVRDTGGAPSLWLANSGSGEALHVEGSLALDGPLVATGLRLAPAAASPNVIGGYLGNEVGAQVDGAAIGGGGASGELNRVLADYGTVGGGTANTASDRWATVAGGQKNLASGLRATVGGGWENTASASDAVVAGGVRNTASADSASISGGFGNQATGFLTAIGGGGRSNFQDPATGNRATDDYGTVAGGGNNQAGDGDGDQTNAPYATVAGGLDNTASGRTAMVPGGDGNIAGGNSSFAAGHQAYANSDGCFVWADYNGEAPLTCNVDNRWVVRAGGGVYFYTNSFASSGVKVNAGGNAWSALSDRSLKANFEALDYEAILEQFILKVPVTAWNYMSEGESIRHIGPVAQDFYGAFGLGGEDRYISTVDADGVALAAIHGLYSQNQALRSELAEMRSEVAGHQARNAELEARVARLEKMAAPSPQPLGFPAGWLLLGGLVAIGGLVVQRRFPGGDR